MTIEKFGSKKRSVEQFVLQHETIHIPEASAEVVDLPAPEASQKKPMVLNPAWGMSPDVYKYLLKGFNDEGRRVLSYTQLRFGGSTDTAPEDSELIRDIPTEIVRNAVTLLNILKAKDIEGAGVVGHSIGGPSAILAALLSARESERSGTRRQIDNLILFGSAGLIGEDTLLRLAKGFASQQSNVGKQSASFAAIPVNAEDRARTSAEDSETTIPEYNAIPETPEDAVGGGAAAPSLAQHVGKNLVRSAQEVWGVSNLQMHGLLAELKKHNIGITVMTGVDDPVFPAEKMTGIFNQQTGELTPGTIRGSDVDGFLTVRAEHGIPVTFAGVIEGQLSALERKHGVTTTPSDTSGE